jgi:hypothetical protein
MHEHDFLWLLKWYHDHCNGDWEHGSSIHIDTLDNPGWSITINLQDTMLEHKKFQEIELEYSKDSWLFCFIKDGKFEGRCGPFNLPEALKIFREWAENCQKESVL